MAARKILMIVGDFVEDYEVMVPYQALVMTGHAVHAVCPGKTAGQRVRTAVHDFEGDQTYSEKPGHGFTLTHDFAMTRVEDYDALVLPGGRAPEYLRLDAEVIRRVRHFFTVNQPVAAICHGVQILAAADVLRGRRATAYPAVGPEISLAGGTYVPVAADEVVVDGQLVTSPAWPAHPKFLAALLRLLGTKIEL